MGRRNTGRGSACKDPKAQTRKDGVAGAEGRRGRGRRQSRRARQGPTHTSRFRNFSIHVFTKSVTKMLPSEFTHSPLGSRTTLLKTARAVSGRALKRGPTPLTSLGQRLARDPEHFLVSRPATYDSALYKKSARKREDMIR